MQERGMPKIELRWLASGYGLRLMYRRGAKVVERRRRATERVGEVETDGSAAMSRVQKELADGGEENASKWFAAEALIFLFSLPCCSKGCAKSCACDAGAYRLVSGVLYTAHQNVMNLLHVSMSNVILARLLNYCVAQRKRG